MSGDLDKLDFFPDDIDNQHALASMAYDADQITPIKQLNFRQRHPKIPALVAVAAMVTSGALPAFGGYELGKSFDNSSRAKAARLAQQHERCLAFVGKISRAGNKSLTVNPNRLPYSMVVDCGLEDADAVSLESTGDANMTLGAIIATVDLPDSETLQYAIHEDNQSAKPRGVFSENEAFGSITAGLAGFVGFVFGANYIIEQKRRKKQEESEEDEAL